MAPKQAHAPRPYCAVDLRHGGGVTSSLSERAGAATCRGTQGQGCEAHAVTRRGAVRGADLGCSSSYSIGVKQYYAVVEDWSGEGFRANSG